MASGSVGLVDHSDALSAAQKEEFRREGVLLLPGLVDRALVDNALRAINAHLGQVPLLLHTALPRRPTTTSTSRPKYDLPTPTYDLPTATYLQQGGYAWDEETRSMQMASPSNGRRTRILPP